MDKLEQRAIKNTWLDWLINYIPISKSVGGLKDKVMSLFKKETKQTKKAKQNQKSFHIKN